MDLALLGRFVMFGNLGPINIKFAEMRVSHINFERWRLLCAPARHPRWGITSSRSKRRRHAEASLRYVISIKLANMGAEIERKDIAS